MSTSEKPQNPVNRLNYASTPEAHAKHLKSILKNTNVTVPGSKIEISHGTKLIKTMSGVVRLAGPGFLSIDRSDQPGHNMTINLSTPPDDSFEYEIRDIQGNVVESGRSEQLRKVEIISTT